VDYEIFKGWDLWHPRKQALKIESWGSSSINRGINFMMKSGRHDPAINVVGDRTTLLELHRAEYHVGVQSRQFMKGVEMRIG